MILSIDCYPLNLGCNYRNLITACAVVFIAYVTGYTPEWLVTELTIGDFNFFGFRASE